MQMFWDIVKPIDTKSKMERQLEDEFEKEIFESKELSEVDAEAVVAGKTSEMICPKASWEIRRYSCMFLW